MGLGAILGEPDSHLVPVEAPNWGGNGGRTLLEESLTLEFHGVWDRLFGSMGHLHRNDVFSQNRHWPV